MDFYAEDLDQLPDLSYLAVVGPLNENLDDELFKRVKRIEGASPEKDKLCLDVRGITGLEADDYELFKSLKDQLEEIGWTLYFCNIPSRFDTFFESNRVQREFNVYQTKMDLLDDFLEDTQKQKEEAEQEEPDPIPVVFRTAEGVRLFQGVANLLKKGVFEVFTSDRNAEVLENDHGYDIMIYFDTNQFQMVPKNITVHEVEVFQGEDWNYRIEVEILDLDEFERETLYDYFNQSELLSA